MSKSRVALNKTNPSVFARPTERLPELVIESLRGMWNDERLDKQIADVERRLQTIKAGQACRAIARIPRPHLRTSLAEGC